MAQKVSDPITVMKRHELKYLLDGEKTAYLRRRLEGHMVPDAFGLTSIASLYYDTPDRRLIRAKFSGSLRRIHKSFGAVKPAKAMLAVRAESFSFPTVSLR